MLGVRPGDRLLPAQKIRRLSLFLDVVEGLQP